MSLNARMTEADPRLYSPTRDLAWCFSTVMTEVSARLEDGRWEFLAKLLTEKGVSMNELGAACEAACKFVGAACDDKKERMGECLARAGFWDVNELANVALSAHIGAVVMGMFWAGAREVTIKGVGPCNDQHDLRAAGAQAYKMISMSSWGRRWLRFKRRCGRIWRAVFGA